jgi:hypothetical protein
MSIKHRTNAERVLAALKLTGMAAALSFIMTLVLAGCPVDPDPESGGGGDFVAVTGISGVPVQAVVNQELPLTGIVMPDNATNKTIAWTVKTGSGTTAPGAAITDGRLKAAGPGDVTVTAAIAKGASETVPYTKDFTITVYAAVTLPTVDSVAVSPSTATVAKGGTQTFTAAVTGANSPAQTVSWSIVESGKAEGTAITPQGKLTVASGETLTSLTVKATSDADNTKSGTAAVTVSAAQELPAPELPDSQGTNALSGKTYFDSGVTYFGGSMSGRMSIKKSTKIEFSATAAGAVSGNYTKKSTVGDWLQPVLDDNGKYKWVDIETGVYSWNAAAKQVTLATRKIAFENQDNQDGYGPLQTKTEYQSSQQAMLNQYKQEMGDEAFNAALAEMGFSSAAAYLDYRVAEAFKNVTKTNNYALSADAEVLFLDEPLPANKGADELAGKTYNGTTGNNDAPVKDTSQTYVFADDGSSCAYTYTTYSGARGNETYNYAFDSTEKRVYLKIPVTYRARSYTDSSTTSAGYYNSVAENKAAEINSRYNRIEVYTYDTTYKMLLPE